MVLTVQPLDKETNCGIIALVPLVAQSVEQLALNQTVVGSNPTRRTRVDSIVHMPRW